MRVEQKCYKKNACLFASCKSSKAMHSFIAKMIKRSAVQVGNGQRSDHKLLDGVSDSAMNHPTPPNLPKSYHLGAFLKDTSVSSFK